MYTWQVIFIRRLTFLPAESLNYLYLALAGYLPPEDYPRIGVLVVLFLVAGSGYISPGVLQWHGRHIPGFPFLNLGAEIIAEGVHAARLEAAYRITPHIRLG